jgi:hypothetical protein
VHHVPQPEPGSRARADRDHNAAVGQSQRDGRGLTALAAFWRGRDIGVVYGIIVIVVSTWIGLHSDVAVRRLVESVSTNLDNMRASPIAVLVASAFVVSPLTQLLLVPVVVFVFGLVQRWLGRMALVAVWVFGHVGATLFVMAMEINALYRHIAHFSIVVKPDVGVSYGMAAAIALLCARVPHRWRLPYGFGCLAVTGAMFAIWPGFTSLGHLTAVVIGLGMAAAVHGGEVAALGTGTSVVSEEARSLSA